MNTYQLNSQQQKAIKAILSFLDSDADCFILKGSAGTGKTTLIGHLVWQLNRQKRICQLIAPTGRAARILRSKTKSSACTIHSAIYALDKIDINDEATHPDHPEYADSNDPAYRFYFPLKQGEPTGALFIVDESSMVGDRENKGDLVQFGSGKLLSDLLYFARMGRYGHPSGDSTKILFVGDPVQLPPVGENQSWALSQDYLEREFNLKSEEFVLTEVMRQVEGGQILHCATQLRDDILQKRFNRFSLRGDGTEIRDVSVQEAVDIIVDSIKRRTSAALVTATNEQALTLNQSVRKCLYGDDNLPIQKGDTLLVNKNSMHFSLYNGDLIKVINCDSSPEVKSIHMKGVDHPVVLSFRSAEISFRDLDSGIVKTRCLLMENLLTSKERELSAAENRALLVDFRKRHKDLKPNTPVFKEAIKSDLYFNAIQVKFGYALTCHKAQGGEWEMAVVNFADTRGHNSEHYFRWCYTAITRASKKLMTIAAPEFNEMSEIAWGKTVPEIVSPVSINNDHGDLKEDSDWLRFSFIDGQEVLFNYFKNIKRLVGEFGAEIKEVTHGQYYERYTISCDEQHTTIQYWYNASGKFTRLGAASKVVEDKGLGSKLSELFEQALFSNDDAEENSENEFIAKFRNRIVKNIRTADIRILSTKSLPYRYRVEFENDGKRAKIDFCHNSKEQWTTVEEVGGLGKSEGLKEKLQKLLS